MASQYQYKTIVRQAKPRTGERQGRQPSVPGTRVGAQQHTPHMYPAKLPCLGRGRPYPGTIKRGPPQV